MKEKTASAMAWTFSISQRWLTYFGAFFFPLFLDNQLILGPIINALILSASGLSLEEALPVLVLPSVAAILRGHLLGVLNAYLLLFAPFIWIGNFLLWRMGQEPYPLRLLGPFLKALFLGGVAWTLSTLGLVPAAMLVPMGFLQFLTAMAGLVIKEVGEWAWKTLRAGSKPI